MNIATVKTSRVEARLPGHLVGENSIDLLTGPNGSGKTEVLAALAKFFRGSRSGISIETRWKSGGKGGYSARDTTVFPRRVVAQTFSPFNRFPAPAKRENSLAAIYGDGQEIESKYICVGLHKASRISSSQTSRRSLEQAIYRASEEFESAYAIIKIMRRIGFEPYFKLTYRAGKQFRGILSSYNQVTALDKLMDLLEKRSISDSVLQNEHRPVDEIELRALVGESLNIVQNLRIDWDKFSLTFGVHSEKHSTDYAALQALSVLRRLDLVTLVSFELSSIDGARFDVSAASSGQQQMLCSVVGLATSLRRDSLVLIDEPELSLHPSWQQTYMDTLCETLRLFDGCHVIVATHSPLIVQRGIALGAGVVQLGDESVREMYGERGSSVEGALLDVFGTPVSDSVYLANEIFSVITDAETGDSERRNKAMSYLNRLKELYARTEDNASIKLLNEASALLAESDDRDG